MTTSSIQKTQSRVIDRISVFDNLPASALMNISEISALACRSNASIWRDVKAGLLPEALKIGPGSSRWLVGDVRRYLKGEVSL
jgi:predicted DNA-binding transcriptional regulator AlpA